MSFRDYENHLLQKYRLAVAIAIIKNTPKNSTPIIHFENLRSNIISEMDPFDPDMTICEDDFNYNDDDRPNNDVDIQMIDDHYAINETQFNDSQTNDSETILKDFDFDKVVRSGDDVNKRKNEVILNNSVSNVLEILKGVENDDILVTQVEIENINPSQNLNSTQSTNCENSQTVFSLSNLETESFRPQKVPKLSSTNEANILPRKDIDTNKENITKNNELYTETTFYDSQQTLLYTLHGFTDNYTHISQSQTDNIVIPSHLLSKKESKDKNSKPSVTDNYCDLKDLNRNRRDNPTNQIVIQYEASRNNLNLLQTPKNNDSSKLDDEKIHANRIKPNAKQRNIRQKNKQENIENENIKRFKIDTFNTADKAYLDEIKSQFNSDNDGLNIEFGDTKHINRFNSEIDILNQQLEISTPNLNSQNSTNSDGRNVSKTTFNSQNFSQFSQEFESEDAFPINKDADKNTLNELLITDIENRDEEIEDMFDTLTDSQTEVVPFKVLEELNKVKSFLNRNDRRNSTDGVSDSGYKSDSQSRSSFKNALHSSNIWLNQSAHTLMTFIIRCPLVVSTVEITNEISRTLGLLIDRLHLEEKYPSFLEEHLEATEVLLKSIFEEELVDDQLLKKDENIHRLLLLNKSSHIITYTIEKIITILENLHSKLISEEILEISNTAQSENLPYIFHVLETLVKKLLIFKNVSSQNSTQNSQDEEPILKKSCITEIWRKKWFSKNVETNAITTKECVLVRCSNVLNKIIVDAMDGYSLISFYALQCFNLMQN